MSALDPADPANPSPEPGRSASAPADRPPDPESSNPRPPHAAGPRPAWGLAAAVGVAGAVTVALLMGRPALRSDSAGAAVRPVAASPVTPARPAGPAPVWSSAHASRWTGGRGRSLAYELDAANTVAVWLKHVRPVLVVRCLGSRTDAFVFTDSPARIEPEPDTRTVRVRLDDGAAVTERWTASAGHDGLFAPDGRQFASRLAAAHRLEFGFTPQNADPVTVAFDLGEVGPVVQQVTHACRGK